MPISTAHPSEVRARLDHPVIDSDGHLREFMPVATEYVARVAGKDIAGRLTAEEARMPRNQNWYGMSDAERRDARAIRPAFWGTPLRNHGVDHATALFPDLMMERLDELGLDFAVLYPSRGVVVQSLTDAEVRRGWCRGLNEYYADIWGGYARRMTPVATIPMHTPAEAIDELEHAVHKLGFKAVMFPSWVKRPVRAIAARHPDMADHAWWADTYGIDSAHDYDPVWQKCVELGVTPTFHGASEGFVFRNSISNIVYNHVGHFAAAADAVCKSLFLGGVARRYPTLKFLFLEGGVGWARSLLADLASHWEKRSLPGLAANTDPRLLDADLFWKLYQDYGGKLKRDMTKEKLAGLYGGRPEDPADSFAGLGFDTKADLHTHFVESFYFGCEGDDPVMASAFDTLRNPGRTRLNAVYGSDIGHWDVTVMNDILHEAHEPVDKGLITQKDFRDFVFGNPARLWTATNPNFFHGTAVEAAVAKELRA